MEVFPTWPKTFFSRFRRFQSFISSVIILHAVVQQKLHHFGESHWRATLEYAEMCIEILAFCGTADRIATRFHEQLKGIYDGLIEDQPVTVNGDTPMGGHHHAVQQHTPVAAEAAEDLPPGDTPSSNNGYLLSFPPGTTPAQRQLSLNLLGMLCRPYDDPTQEQQSEPALKARWSCEAPRDEDVRMVEREDWEFERAKPFRWDATTLGPASAFLSRDGSSSCSASRTEDGGTGSEGINSPVGPRNATGSSWLLGSRSPSGWTPADALRPA